MKSLINLVRENDTDSVVELLEEHPEGVNSSEKSGNYYSALHYAVLQEAEELVVFLLASNANPNKQDKYGDTPLHIAAGRGYFNIVVLLLGADSDPRIKNNSGYTAFNAALNSGNRKLIGLLRGYMFPESK